MMGSSLKGAVRAALNGHSWCEVVNQSVAEHKSCPAQCVLLRRRESSAVPASTLAERKPVAVSVAAYGSNSGFRRMLGRERPNLLAGGAHTGKLATWSQRIGFSTADTKLSCTRGCGSVRRLP